MPSRATWSLLLLFFLTACGRSVEPLPGEGPVAGFERMEHWLTVFADRQAQREDIVSLSQIGPYRPGFSPAQAHQRFGQPLRTIGPDRGHSYVEYSTQFGRVRVGVEESSSGDGVSRTYPLYFYPDNRRPEAFLAPVVTSRLRTSLPKETVMIFECGFAGPYLLIDIEGGQIGEVIWSEERKLRRRSDPSRCVGGPE
jgi:hypothetical protein